MKKKKVGFIIPGFNAGGAERVVSTLSNHLILNYEVIIIVLYECEIFYQLNDNISIIFCEGEYRYTSNRLKGLIRHINFIKKIVQITRDNDIKMLIGFTTTANLYTIATSQFTKVPCIISERIHPEFSPISNFVNMVRKLLYPLAHILVVQTQDIFSYFSKFIKAEKIKVIHNPINPSLLSKRNRSLKKENVILNVGRIDYQKNQDMLVKAFANIDNSDWKLVIIGSGSEMDSLNQLIKDLNLVNKVELTGNIDDVSSYYNKAKIFAFTSRFEGFPNALTEAMAFGLACISTNCPSGPSELIKDGINGFLIPNEDQKALEIKLSTLMIDDNKRKLFSRTASKNMDKFNVGNVSRKWELLINDLIQNDGNK